MRPLHFSTGVDTLPKPRAGGGGLIGFAEALQATNGVPNISTFAGF